MGQTGLTTEEHVEIWRRYRTGESMRSDLSLSIPGGFSSWR